MNFTYKIFFIILGIVLLSEYSNAQSVGVGTTNPNAKSALDIVSTDQGLLVPRVDDAGMAAIGASIADDDGMLVYNTTQDKFLYFEFTTGNWEPIAAGGSDLDWIENGSVIYNETHYVVVGQQAAIAYIKMLVVNNGLRTALAGSSNGNGKNAIGVEGYATEADANIGVFGLAESVASTDTVVGVYGEAKNILNVGAAVRGEANTGTDGLTISGGSFEARDDVGSGFITGVEAIGDGNSVAKEVIGIRAAAFGGGKNWAGYFETGNVFVQDNVGIGVQIPTTPLQIQTLVGTELSFTGASNADISASNQLNINSNGVTMLNANSISLRTASTTRMLIENGGNVGIGAAPNEKLTVNGNAISISETAALVGPTAGYGKFWVNSTNSHPYFSDDLGNTWDLTDVGGPDADWTVSGTDVYNNLAGVNVGIGTNAPTTPLHVMGDARFSSTGVNSSRAYTIRSGGRQEIFATNDLVEHIGSGKVVIVNNSAFSVASGNESTKFFTADAPSQSVGIGTTGPNAKLHVEGGRIRVASGASIMDLYQTGTRTRLETSNLFEIAPNGGGTAFEIDDGDAVFNVWTNVNGKFSVIDGTQGLGKIFTSNAGGTGSWETTASQGLVTGSGTATQVAYWNGTNSLTSESNLYWDQGNNRLGIGTSTPGYNLDVRSTGGTRINIDGGSTSDVWTYYGQAGTFRGAMGFRNGGVMTFFNGADRMVILNNGRVGIGTTAPESPLDVRYTDGIRLGGTTSKYIHMFTGGTGNDINSEGGTLHIEFDSDQNVQIGNTDLIVETAAGRVEMQGTTDASGTAGTGVLEIANSLRLDGNEIITNTNDPLYLQHGNDGDLWIDQGTFMVDASANRVGIGTTAPNSTLNIVSPGGTDYGFRTSGENRNRINSQLSIDGNTSSAYTLYVTGNAWCIGTWGSSDERWKKNIKTYNGALDKVMQLRGVNYEWRTNEFSNMHFDEGVQIGFIAQEVEAVIPEFVKTDDDGFKAVSYDKMSAILVEATKEQQNQIEDLKSENAKLKSELEAIKKHLGIE